ncbi:SH3 domain-containing protein [Xylariales sp. AK1849]|nr:SH3 domain-containing protein [Xylariales sp. AK1849]
MGFLGVYKAIYDYAPQSAGELSISEGDVLYVLEKDGDDDWWKAKKRASADEDDEPVGLIPNNYVEEAPVLSQARALFDYSRQTDEEISFSEDARLQVFDASDPDWILVGSNGDYGFAPANYIEVGDGGDEPGAEAEAEPDLGPAAPPPPPSLPVRPPAPVESEPQSPALPGRRPSAASETTSPVSTPAAALAGVMQGRSSTRAAEPPPIAIPPRRQYLSEESEDEPSPALPIRPRSQSTLSNDQTPKSPPPQRTTSRRRDYDDHVPAHTTGRIAPGGFHMYNINEMVSVMGKKKKMPTTLGVNLKTGLILIAPERPTDGPNQEWSADRMTHYSREGKHVFLELVRPSRSIDFHAGAKDTAEEIVSALGELSGAVKAEGLREVIMAGTGHGGQKKGHILYDFMAQGEDEVTVAIGDEVLVIDNTKSEEWWQVRRLKNGKEGVVPSSYIEITETVTSPTTSGINAGRSTVAQNRLEEERLTKEAIKRDQKAAEVGPGMRLPERNSSLSAWDNSNQSDQQRSKRENGRAEGSGSRSSSSKSKPDPSKIRVWTDRSKSFSVEAQFLGLKDGKINLHKMNGVKIAVPIAKMSAKDIEYVELMTGISLDEDKPLSDVKRLQSARNNVSKEAAPKVGASIESSKPEYDWFQFFLSCEVAVGLCERYAQSFDKDSMDESVLPDVDAGILRNLGLREGDIIKVMRHLDKKYGREGKKRNVSFAGDDDAENGTAGGLFSGPGGTLRNNTRKGRPAPTTQTNDSIDAKAFAQQKVSGGDASSMPSLVSTRTKAGEKSTEGGFDDDAWDVKPSRQPDSQAKAAPAPVPTPTTPQEPQRPPTQAMLDLSLLTQPLEPTKTQPTPAPSQPQVVQPPSQATPQQLPPATTQPLGASPAFFTGLAQQQTGLQPAPTGQIAPAQPLNLGLGGSRQRPIAPQTTQGQPGLMPPPPARPLSAPQSAQPSAFTPPPLQPQMTGIAPPGQSLNDLNQQRMLQQQQQYMGGFQPQSASQGMMGFNAGTGTQPQRTGFGPNQFMQPAMTGAPQMQSPFADPRGQQFSPIQNQPTGFPGGFHTGQQFPQATGVNSFLPPALEPQRTAAPQMQAPMPPQQPGFGGSFGPGFNPGMNNQASQPPAMAPLQPQQTGPAPPVRFGVPDKIVPQATGRRANLAHATPQNPFGF